MVKYYKTCLTSLGNQEAKTVMGDSDNKRWAKLLSFKITFYSAIVMVSDDAVAAVFEVVLRALPDIIE